MNKRTLTLFVILLLGVSRFSFAQRNDKALILKEITRIPVPDSSKYICATYITNELPQIIATTQFTYGETKQLEQVNAIVSSRLGKGKIIVFGSNAYFKKPLIAQQEVKKLLQNTLTWGKTKKSPSIQLWERDEDLSQFFSKEKYQVSAVKDNIINKNTDILILTTDVPDSLQRVAITAFIKSGGTLIFGSPLPKILDKLIRSGQYDYTFYLHKLFIEAGLSHDLHAIIPEFHNLNTINFPAYLHITTILKTLRNYQSFDNAEGSYIANATLEAALRHNPLNSSVFENIKQAYKINDDSLFIPSVKNPLYKESNEYKKYLQQHTPIAWKIKGKDPNYVAPASRVFPGEVPKGASRVTELIILPVQVGTQGLWDPAPIFYRPHSTGFYVPPGEKVKVRINTKDLKLKLKAQIGLHDDNLLKNEDNYLHREGFDLTRNFELATETTEIYSPYGGILLINIPDTTSLKTISVEVSGAVKYPYFKLGKTTLKDWQETIRHYKAPWAELATDKIILTVPASRIRALDDPEKPMKFWDEVMDTNARLANISSNRVHPERMIVDEQVMVGYMFATNYKIVIPNDEFTFKMLDEPHMRANGSWGHFHELGHRHQFWGIDFEGLGEVSVNLYTMYVYDKLLKKGIYNTENIASKKVVTDKVKDYMSKKPSYKKFSDDPFVALGMYIQIIEGFGWEPIEKVYKEFRAIPKEQYPETDSEKRDLWFAHMCTATKKDLSTFFDKWQIPISDKMKLAVAKYPKWLPEEMR